MNMGDIFEKSKTSKLLMFLVACLLSACTSGNSEAERLKYALDFAGDNRGELEKVLEHYKADTLKLEASKFLISNMPHYYSYEGRELDSAKVVLAHLAHSKDWTSDSPWVSYNYYSLPKVYDAHVITADYLIDNIDRAFKAWKGRTWNANLSFEDFCELLLPYRVGDEPLSDWRPLYEQYYVNFLDSAYQGNDVLEACSIVNDELCRQDCKFFSKMAVPHYDATLLFHNRAGYCRENCDLGLYAMRVCGIPVAKESFKFSPDYRNSHQWLTVRDTSGVYIQFGYDGMKPQRGVKRSDGRKKGKVFRTCFGIQEAQVHKYDGVHRVPADLKNVYKKDVTANYFGANLVKVPIQKTDKEVFLGAFATDGWKPIDMGVGKNGCATFVDIEPDVIYMPLVYDESQELREAGYPFVYEGKTRKVRLLKGNMKMLEKVALTRKMPLKAREKEWLWRCIIGGKLEASEEASFKNPYLLYDFKDTLDHSLLRIKNNSKRKFRYVRYTGPQNQNIEFAGLNVFEDSLCQRKIHLKLFTKLDSLFAPQNITDDDMLSVFVGDASFHSLVFEMEHETSIGGLDFYPRTDGNFVWTGDQYELFYQDGISGWKSLGVKTAQGKNIEFMAPKGAVLWLRDLTTGVEEQIFLYHDGKQQFVYDM